MYGTVTSTTFASNSAGYGGGGGGTVYIWR